MKKSDLKTGMIVTLRDGREFMVFLNADTNYCSGNGDFIVELHNNNWNSLKYYNEDLEYSSGWIDDYRSDIVKVELMSHPYDLLVPRTVPNYKRKLLWEREKPVKEVTMAEVEEKFGCKVKIVKE